MKRIVSILLVFSMLHLCQPPRQQEANGGVIVVAFVIGCVAAGSAVVIWLMIKSKAPAGTYYWVLEKSHYDGQWTPVSTNAARMVEEHAWEAFEVQRDWDKTAIYRIKQLDFLPAGGTNTLLNPNIVFDYEWHNGVRAIRQN